MPSIVGSGLAPLSLKIYLAIVVGLTSHLAVFIRGEWHTKAPRLLVIYLMLCPCTLALEMTISSLYDPQSLWTYLLLLAAYSSSIIASMTIYRTQFHRLNDFPGPFLAKVTKLWHVAHVLGSRNHLLLGKFRQQYGDFVRTGKTYTFHMARKQVYLPSCAQDHRNLPSSNPKG